MQVELELRTGRQVPPSSLAFVLGTKIRDEVADALHNHAMSSTQFHALQLPGAQEFVHSAPTDIEQVRSAVDGNGQTIVEIDWVKITTFAHAGKNRRNLNRET